MTRVRIDLAYDGGLFSGWARQPGLPSVQAVLEGALGTILARPVRATVAGRTDAGVHARGQVVHVDISEDEWELLARDGQEGAARRLNAVIPLLLRGKMSAERLPEQKLAAEFGLTPHPAERPQTQESSDAPNQRDTQGGRAGERRRRTLRAGNPDRSVWVKALTPVSEDFDARFSALSRTYTYTVADALSGFDPLGRATHAWVAEELDVDAMAAAADLALGLRDFLAFCKPRDEATTIRELQELSVTRGTDNLVRFRLTADAFCHHMVRSLVGALLRVGSGKDDGVWFSTLFSSPRRDGAVVMAPAHALVLESVQYPPESEWARRAGVTRDRRTEPHP